MSRVILALCLALTACGPGIGETTASEEFVTLPCGRKFVSFGFRSGSTSFKTSGATSYRGAALWVASRAMRDGEVPETVLIAADGDAVEVRECAAKDGAR